METLENSLVAPYFPVTYYLAMRKDSFRDRILAALDEQKMSKAELSRRSKVPYHALDKFLKREGATTGVDNARAIANTLGIKVDDDSDFESIRSLFYQLNKEQREFLLKSIEGLLS